MKLKPAQIALNIAAFFIVVFSYFFQRDKYKQIQEDRRKKIAAAFLPVFTQELTKIGDLRQAYDVTKKKMSAPDWERFHAFLKSAEYLNESKALRDAAMQFNSNYGRLPKLQFHQLQTYFRKVSLPEQFDRAFIIIWLYTFHKERMPDIKK